MAKTFYSYQKRQKELERKKKKELKRQNRLKRKSTESAEKVTPAQDEDETP